MLSRRGAVAVGGAANRGSGMRVVTSAAVQSSSNAVSLAAPWPLAQRSEEFFSYRTPGVRKVTRGELEPQWGQLGFNIRAVNGYVKYLNTDRTWDQGSFVPAPYILLHINSGALHYAVSCFEGLKAFASKDGSVKVMNPTMNALRMQEGARKLRMPEVPIDMFVEGVKEAVKRNLEFVPPHGTGAAMYIRPLLFASGQMLGLAPLAEEFTFAVTVSPVGGYFRSDGPEEGLDALVMENHDRAAPMGTGAVKASGNYAADIEPVHMAKERGYATTLYLDAKERRYIEEFSVCNFVGITKDGKFVTPQTDSILPSTTNQMLQQLACDMGLEVERRPVDFDKEIDNFIEIGMVGTAAVIVKVRSITRFNKVYKSGPFNILHKLRKEFAAIQCGDMPDKHGWMMDICTADASYEATSCNYVSYPGGHLNF